MQSDFIEYQKQVLTNAKIFSLALKDNGFRIITGNTDNHLLLVDTKSTFDITGKDTERLLDSILITCNKNTIPFDQEKPMVTSGIRLGTPAMTTRGFKEPEFIQVAKWIRMAIDNRNNVDALAVIKQEVLKLTAKFPVSVHF